MRILQVFNRYLERGGEEESVERISNVLAKRHEVFHCYFDSRMWTHESTGFDNIRHILWMFYNPGAVERFRRQVQACRPDLILVHNVFPVGSIGVLREATRLGIPVFHVVHNFRPFSVNGYLWADGHLIPQGLKRNFIPEVLAGAWQDSRPKTAVLAGVLWVMHLMGIYDQIDCWLAISRFMRDAFVGAGIPAEKVFVLRHSWNARRGSLEPEARSQSAEGPSLLFLGRLTESKGVEVLLKAWELAAAKAPSAKLFIGGSGPMEKLVSRAAAKLPRCEYVGQVGGARKEELLTNCTAMVVPSVWWEPLGLVTYEAYDYGKPVLAAAAGGLSETILPGETGWVHTPGDVEQLAAQIVEALNDPEECQRRGTNGRNWLQQHTRTEDWLDEFDVIANEILSKPKFQSPLKPATQGKGPRG